MRVLRSRYEITCPFIGISLRLLMPFPEFLRSSYSLTTAYTELWTCPFCFLIQGLKVQPVGFAQNFLDASTGYAVLSTSTSTVKQVSNRWKIYRLRENWNSV